MGSPPAEPERRPGEDQVEVTLSKGFWIGKYEVTQGQWNQVMGHFPGQYTAGQGMISRCTTSTSLLPSSSAKN
jgi:formylglycine-generating enzyme required for sulfatase activity